MGARSDAARNWVNVHDFYHCFVVRTLLPNHDKLNPNLTSVHHLPLRSSLTKFNDKVCVNQPECPHNNGRPSRAGPHKNGKTSPHTLLCTELPPSLVSSDIL